jgi:hypothetical protein
VSSDKVEAMVVDIHHNKEDFDEGNLIDRIYEYDVYEERNIPIENITSPWEVDEALVDEYIKKGSENMPPIVIDSDYDIIDGTHRFAAVKRLGLETIKAYIGVENETPT